ncbi:MAG TPA: TylF/MycF family methyltransferase [Actinomycetota bacterium]|nr:TylF/MycF family methyltransferase [Actinomycetota bacterium]
MTPSHEGVEKVQANPADGAVHGNEEASIDRYLDVLKNSLTRAVGSEKYRPLGPVNPWRQVAVQAVNGLLRPLSLEVVKRLPFDPHAREHGLDRPAEAETMIGLRRLENIRFCVEDVLRRSVPGDLIETGVWRGGACIFMRAVLKAHGVVDRNVWLADSFQGLPKPDARYAQDAGDLHHTAPELSVSRSQVEDNFRRYGLLDDQVKFLVGWFADTLPGAPIERLAVLRLDGDMYGSTIQALESLYDKLSKGGYVIVDDYTLKGCRAATDDFRRDRGISDEPIVIDRSGAVYWEKS